MREQREGSEWILSCQRSFRLRWGCTNDLCCHLSFSAVVVGVVTELARECVLSELVYVDNLFLMSETFEALRNKFTKWKEAFKSKALKVNLEKS